MRSDRAPSAVFGPIRNFQPAPSVQCSWVKSARWGFSNKTVRSPPHWRALWATLCAGGCSIDSSRRRPAKSTHIFRTTTGSPGSPSFTHPAASAGHTWQRPTPCWVFIPTKFGPRSSSAESRCSDRITPSSFLRLPRARQKNRCSRCALGRMAGDRPERCAVVKSGKEKIASRKINGANPLGPRRPVPGLRFAGRPPYGLTNTSNLHQLGRFENRKKAIAFFDGSHPHSHHLDSERTA